MIDAEHQEEEGRASSIRSELLAPATLSPDRSRESRQSEAWRKEEWSSVVAFKRRTPERVVYYNRRFIIISRNNPQTAMSQESEGAATHLTPLILVSQTRDICVYLSCLTCHTTDSQIVSSFFFLSLSPALGTCEKNIEVYVQTGAFKKRKLKQIFKSEGWGSGRVTLITTDWCTYTFLEGLTKIFISLH